VENFRVQWMGAEALASVDFWVMPDGRVRHPHVRFIVPSGAQALYEPYLRSNALHARFTPAPNSGPVHCDFVEVETLGYHISSVHGLGKAMDLTKRAADRGDTVAQATYGLMSNGSGRSYTNAEPGEWYLKAARAGDPVGQRELGRMLLEGSECVPDERKGVFWLERAAAGDDAEALVILAARALSDANDAQRYEHAKALLERAAKLPDDDAILTLAALLATSPQQDIRDPKRSLELMQLSFNRVSDDPMTFEIRAAARAAGGDFTAAVDDQTTALAMAAKLKWSTAAEQERLDAYKAGRPWVGELEGF